ncbi:unnamed protein product [Didymodactylos carnosus]|uniref:Uncharacterized protein n=1 Tax=Didymodactylos carnosus TaxID=1234261 RepID=A0A8S2H103_9BILA|nr:unnamed protein product [Didymodactylos carnosus]CAF3585851.1 unnamed protein product [Didymodactylos carnosus]
MLPSQTRHVIAINIETLAGSTFELLVSPFETVTSIKRKIERREGIPVSHQHLVWKTKELEDESCLHDYNIGDGTTIILVLAMRGGPVNTKRVPIEDSLIRDMSEYIETKEDYSDLFPGGTSNKNVTFLVLRDGDQFNFFQLIDRGDGTLSPMSGSMSTASMYNTHEGVDVERVYDEKRQAEDRKTKQKMELIKSKLKNTPTLSSKKETQLLPPRPPSGAKSKTIRQTLTTSYPVGSGTTRSRRYGGDRNIVLDPALNNINDTEVSSTATTILVDNYNNNISERKRIPNTISTTNIFNTYNLLSAKNLQEDDEDDDEEDEDDESNDEEKDSDEYKTSSMITAKKLFGSTRSFSPSILSNGFYSSSATAVTTPLISDTITTKKQLSLSSLKNSLEQQQQQSRIYQHYHDKKKVSMTKRETTKSSIETILTTGNPSTNLGLNNQDITNSQATTTNDLSTIASSAKNDDLLLDYIHRLSPIQSQPLPPSPRITCSAKRLSDQTQSQSAFCTTTVANGNTASCGTATNEIYHHLSSSTALDLDDDTIGTTNNYASLRKLQQSPFKCLHSSLSNSNDSYLRKQTAGSISNTGGDNSNSRNDTSLSKWPDTPSPQSKIDGHFVQDDDIIIGEQSNTNERTVTSHSLFRHQNSSSSTITPAPTLPNLPHSARKTQRYHHTTNSTSSTVSFDQQRSSPSLNVRPLVPLSLSKYRRMPPPNTTNIPQGTNYSTTFFQNQTNDTPSTPTNDWFKNTTTTTPNDSFNEHLMLSKRIEMLKTGKQQQQQQQATIPPSPSSSSTAIFPSPPSILSTKRDSNNENKPTTKSVVSSTSVTAQGSPYDSTKVTIETIGPKTVSALLRQNATIEPVDTSRGVGKHLVSLLTTASKETSIKEERYKLDSKLNPWSTTSINGSTVSSLNSTTATIYSNTNSNKLPPVIISRKPTAKCFLCKKKTGLATTYSCRCGSSFCSEHRYPEAHNCPYDYKAEGKRLIERNNPVNRKCEQLISESFKTTVMDDEGQKILTDIVTGTNYLLQQLNIDRRIRTVAEFCSDVLIPIYEKICLCQLKDVRLPIRNLQDEIHNINVVINALCFETVEFDLSHITGEQITNGDAYAMNDLLEILTDVYQWIKANNNKTLEQESLPPSSNLPSVSDRSAITTSLGARIVAKSRDDLENRKNPYSFTNEFASNSLVISQISPILSPSTSPRHTKQLATANLNDKYDTLLKRFEQTVQMSTDALHLKKTEESNLKSVLDDLNRSILSNQNIRQRDEQYVSDKHHHDTFTINSDKENDVEDDLALLLNTHVLEPSVIYREQDQRQRSVSGNTLLHQSNNDYSCLALDNSKHNRLNRSDEFYQIRTQLKRHYNQKSNLNQFLKEKFDDDLEDYKSTTEILNNKQKLRKIKQNEIENSLLKVRLPSSSSNTTMRPTKSAGKKGYLRSSTTSLVKHRQHSQSALELNNHYDDEEDMDENEKKSLKRSMSKRLLMANEHDLIPILNEQFPHMYSSTEMQTKLNEQFSKHIDSLFKARVELINAQTGNINDLEEAKKKHDRITEILRKELVATQRQQDSQLKQSAERILRSKIRDQRIQSARTRRYYNDFRLQQRKRLLKKRTNEELILKQAYDESIKIQKERLYEMKKYKQQYNDLFMKRYKTQLDSLENYYRERLEMFKEQQVNEQTIKQRNDNEEKLELDKQRQQLRKQLEQDIKQLHEHLADNTDYMHYRQLDLDKLKENLIQARITTKV